MEANCVHHVGHCERPVRLMCKSMYIFYCQTYKKPDLEWCHMYSLCMSYLASSTLWIPHCVLLGPSDHLTCTLNCHFLQVFYFNVTLMPSILMSLWWNIILPVGTTTLYIYLVKQSHYSGSATLSSPIPTDDSLARSTANIYIWYRHGINSKTKETLH